MSAILVAYGLVAATPAAAHPHWINQGKYTDEFGTHCCDERDVEELAPERVKPVAGGYMLDGDIFVPHRKVKPSEDGKWWVAWKRWGREVRCFFDAQGGV